MAAAADVVGSAPVDELVSGGRRAQEVARPSAGKCRPQPPQRIGVGAAPHLPVLGHQAQHAIVALDAPALAAGVLELSAWRESQLAERAQHDCLLTLEARAHVDAVELAQQVRHARRELGAPFLVEHVDAREATRRADGQVRPIGFRPRREHAQVAERRLEAQAILYGGLGVVGHDDDGVVLEKRVDASGDVHDALERPIGHGDRGHLRVGAAAVRVGVIVRQREEHEVEEVVLNEVRPDAAGVLVALAGHTERRSAARLAGREQIGVEELARAPCAVRELRGPGETRIDARTRGVVARAAAVDQVRGAGGAHTGVVEVLEHRPPLARKVREVEVVDGVDERTPHAVRL